MINQGPMSEREFPIATYSPPKLSLYGKVVELTAAGTRGVLESGSGSSNKKI